MTTPERGDVLEGWVTGIGFDESETYLEIEFSERTPPRPDVWEKATILRGRHAGDEIKALRDSVAGLLRVIERDIHQYDRIDHACEQCIPGGDSVSEGFVCVTHRARSLLPTPEGEG